MSYSSPSVIRKAQSGDIQARNRLVEENMGLVWHVVNRFTPRGILSKDDLVQEGVIGLMKAIDGFDASKGFQFSTYAAEAIRRSILRAIQDYGTTIRISNHRYSNGDLDEYHNIMNPASLSAPVGEGSVFGDMIADDQAAEEFDAVEGSDFFIHGQEIDVEEILALLDTLIDSQRETVERRLGLNGYEPHTLEAIGKVMGSTRQAVAHREGKAYINLRKAWEARHQSEESVNQPVKVQAGSRRRSPSDEELMAFIRRLPAYQRVELVAYYG